jgi:hypothetical protein
MKSMKRMFALSSTYTQAVATKLVTNQAAAVSADRGLSLHARVRDDLISLA